MTGDAGNFPRRPVLRHLPAASRANHDVTRRRPATTRDWLASGDLHHAVCRQHLRVRHSAMGWANAEQLTNQRDGFQNTVTAYRNRSATSWLIRHPAANSAHSRAAVYPRRRRFSSDACRAAPACAALSRRDLLRAFGQVILHSCWVERRRSSLRACRQTSAARRDLPSAGGVPSRVCAYPHGLDSGRQASPTTVRKRRGGLHRRLVAVMQSGTGEHDYARRTLLF